MNSNFLAETADPAGSETGTLCHLYQTLKDHSNKYY